MKTIDILNPAFVEEQNQFDFTFRKKLKALLKYKKMNQDQLAWLCNKKTQNATSRWMTFNEKYKTSPNISEVLAMCSLLRIHISYFFESEMSCEDGDMDLFHKSGGNLSKSTFINTSIVQRIFKSLNKIQELAGVGCLVTAGKNGTSRALKEYASLNNCLLFPNLASYIMSDSISQTDRQPMFLIFDNCERMPSSEMDEIIKTRNLKQGCPIVFIGKKLSLPTMPIDYHYNIGVLTTLDVESIVSRTLPKTDEKERKLICSRLVGGINEIASFLSKN